MFERSKWLHEGMIYLELLLCCALESWLLMCGVKMASFKRGDRERKLQWWHTHRHTDLATPGSTGHWLYFIQLVMDIMPHMCSSCLHTVHTVNVWPVNVKLEKLSKNTILTSATVQMCSKNIQQLFVNVCINVTFADNVTLSYVQWVILLVNGNISGKIRFRSHFLSN